MKRFLICCVSSAIILIPSIIELRAATRFTGGLGDTPSTLNRFGSSPGPSISITGGNPGGVMVLTQPVNSQHNFVTFDRSDIGVAVASTFRFDFRIAPTATPSADGISFTFAHTALIGVTGGLAAAPFTAEEPALAGSIGIGFDTYNNWGPYDDPALPFGSDYSEISVSYFGTLVGRISDTRRLPVPVRLDDAAWHTVTGGVDFMGGTLNLALDGNVIYSALVIPGLLPYESRIVIAGSTRGENELALVDNVNVEFVSAGEPYPSLRGVRVRASSFYAPDGRVPAGAVNGNGLLGRLHRASSPGGAMWLSAQGDVNPTFDIDLGGVHAVDDLRIWNYNENAHSTCCLDRGVALADVYVAGADGLFNAVPILTDVELDRAPGTMSDFSQVVSLGGAHARYVRLAVKANHGDASFTGLSEVNVTGNPVAGQSPLPATIASVSSDLVGDRKAAYVVNGAGRLFGDAQSAVPDGTMWLSQGTFGAEELLYDLAPEITFDLGSERAIDSMKVWNYNEYRPDLPQRVAELLGRGVALANVLIAGEDMVFSTLYELLALDRAPEVGETADFGQLVDMQGTTARFVKLRILANHNGKDFRNPADDDGLDNFAGLSEVQFFELSPEFSPGDINRDGRVNRQDVALFAQYFGTTAGGDWETDFDGDGLTTLDDLALLQSHLGTITAAAAVPEPPAFVLLWPIALLVVPRGLNAKTHMARRVALPFVPITHRGWPAKRFHTVFD